MSKTLRHRAQRVAFYILLAIILIYLIFPFYWAIRSSITPNSEMFTTPISYWPHNPTLEFYREVFSDRLFMRSMLNSTIVAGSVTII
jgi:trehalose/maltose transport system permease protein